MPVLTAVRIRPGIILRPNETHIPRAGIIQSILALLFVVVALGIIAGQIIGNILVGVIGTAATLTIMGILIGLLWLLVWLIGRIPAFGNVSLRLALRNLRARRARYRHNSAGTQRRDVRPQQYYVFWGRHTSDPANHA